MFYQLEFLMPSTYNYNREKMSERQNTWGIKNEKNGERYGFLQKTL